MCVCKGAVGERAEWLFCILLLWSWVRAIFALGKEREVVPSLPGCAFADSRSAVFGL